MKQLFLKKLIPFCAVAILSATANVNATEIVNLTEQTISAETAPVNDIPFFKGHRQGRGVTLQWVANNAESFLIETSTDGEFWDFIATKSANNNSRHNFNIPEVFPGTAHYRIKATMADGSEVYSEVVTVRVVQRK